METLSTSPDPAALWRGVMAESGVAVVDSAALWTGVMTESGVT